MDCPTDALPDGLRHLADPVMAFDERGTVVGWNPSLAEVVGPPGVDASTPDRIPTDDDADRVRASVRRVLDDGVVTHERRPGGGSAISVVLPRAGAAE